MYRLRCNKAGAGESIFDIPLINNEPGSSVSVVSG
jgi:hypothetical protein